MSFYRYNLIHNYQFDTKLTNIWKWCSDL